MTLRTCMYSETSETISVHTSKFRSHPVSHSQRTIYRCFLPRSGLSLRIWSAVWVPNRVPLGYVIRPTATVINYVYYM